MRIFSVVLLALFSFEIQGAQWTWTDFEIFGFRHATREQIVAEIPIRLATPFEDYPNERAEICEHLKAKFHFAYVKCSVVKWVDGRTWFTVDVVEEEDLPLLEYRQIGVGSVPWQELQLPLLLTLLLERQSILFSQQVTTGEYTDGDIVNYSDPVMREYVERLRVLAPQYRAQLVNMVREDSSELKRSQASYLLYWAGSPQKSIAELKDVLFDPSMTVRNDLVRFMAHWTGTLGDRALRLDLARSFAKLLRYPSHADRNKGLYGLMALIEKHPDDRSEIRSFVEKNLDYLAQNSTIDNVGFEAIRLLRILRSQAP